MRKSLSECRNEAIKERDATVAVINQRYDAERRKEDRLFDAEFDRVRDEFECIRKKDRGQIMRRRKVAGMPPSKKPTASLTPT